MGEIAYNIALLSAGMSLAVGLYILLANILKLPRIAVTKAVLNVIRQDKKQTKILEVLVFDLSSKLANYIRLEEYKKRKAPAKDGSQSTTTTIHDKGRDVK